MKSSYSGKVDIDKAPILAGKCLLRRKEQPKSQEYNTQVKRTDSVFQTVPKDLKFVSGGITKFPKWANFQQAHKKDVDDQTHGYKPGKPASPDATSVIWKEIVPGSKILSVQKVPQHLYNDHLLSQNSTEETIKEVEQLENWKLENKFNLDKELLLTKESFGSQEPSDDKEAKDEIVSHVNYNLQGPHLSLDLLSVLDHPWKLTLVRESSIQQHTPAQLSKAAKRFRIEKFLKASTDSSDKPLESQTSQEMEQDSVILPKTEQNNMKARIASSRSQPNHKNWSQILSKSLDMARRQQKLDLLKLPTNKPTPKTGKQNSPSQEKPSFATPSSKHSPQRSFDVQFDGKILANSQLNQKISLSLSRNRSVTRDEKNTQLKPVAVATHSGWKKFSGPFSFDLIQDVVNSIKRYNLKLQEQISVQKSKVDNYDSIVKKSTEHNLNEHLKLKYMTMDLDYYRNSRILDPRYRNIFRPPSTMKYVATKLEEDPHAETNKERLTKICEIQSEFQEGEDKIAYIKAKLVELYRHLLWDHRSWM